MKGLLTKWLHQTNFSERFQDEEQWRLDVDSLYILLANFYGTDKLVLKASKLNALNLMRSEQLVERVLGLKKIITDDPMGYELPMLEEIPDLLTQIEERIAEVIARRSVEERLKKLLPKKCKHDMKIILKRLSSKFSKRVLDQKMLKL